MAATQLSRALGVGVLLLFSALSMIFGAIAWSRSTTLHLPIPTSLLATSTILPILLATLLLFTTIITTTTTTTTRSLHLPTRIPIPTNPQTRLLILQLLSTISPILATLAYTYFSTSPGSTLPCTLDQQWQSYFRTKNGAAIRSIQDRLQCCGFRSSRDRAWPFPDREHGGDACLVRFGYRRACFGEWRGQAREVAGLVLVGAVLGWVVVVGFSYFQQRSSWFEDVSAAGERGERVADEEPQYRRITNVEEDQDGHHANANAADTNANANANVDAEAENEGGYRDHFGDNPFRDDLP